MSLPAWRAYERFRAGQRPGTVGSAGHDSLPLPPPDLLVRVVGNSDAEMFLDSGERTAQVISACAARHGLPISQAGRLLDFGCGCGRVARHWHAFPDARIAGVDSDAKLVEWVRTNLPFMDVALNTLAPPLAYPDQTFGLVYAISVFTHMTEELAISWIDELRRVLRPGGLLMFSVAGSTFTDRLRRRERTAFDRGEMVVQFKECVGTNLCFAVHPETYVRRLIAEFEYLEMLPPSETDGAVPHDLWVVRRPAN